MAKSKNKSKKKTAAKSSKSKKTASSSKVQKLQKTTVSAPRRTEVANSVPILMGVIISFIAALLMGLLIIGTADDRSIKSSAKPTTNPNSQQTIEVTEPAAEGTPKSPDYKLQGSTQQEQQAAEGDLQKQDPANELQPNAGIEDYENAEIN